MLDPHVFSERMKVWFTPRMLASDQTILRELYEIAAHYDALNGNLSTGTFDEIMAESDKLQAELWRRAVHKVLDGSDFFANQS